MGTAGESLSQCQAGSGRFGVIRVIAVPTAACAMQAGRGHPRLSRSRPDESTPLFNRNRCKSKRKDDRLDGVWPSLESPIADREPQARRDFSYTDAAHVVRSERGVTHLASRLHGHAHLERAAEPRISREPLTLVAPLHLRNVTERGEANIAVAPHGVGRRRLDRACESEEEREWREHGDVGEQRE
jgi:hypothetical protein